MRLPPRHRPRPPRPGIDAHLEEVLLAGLGRAASLELLAKVVERPLTEEEKNWAGDLWFESEGLPSASSRPGRCCASATG